MIKSTTYGRRRDGDGDRTRRQRSDAVSTGSGGNVQKAVSNRGPAYLHLLTFIMTLALKM